MTTLATALIAAGASVIVGVLTLIGVIVTNNATSAVMQTKLDNLTKAVEQHNDFAKRVPILEHDVKTLMDERADDYKQLKSKLP